ncbi:MAG: MerR family transcriptional regulator [Actinobacteria bacterium]|nr:MerR family transcriptional regulator [Actinomycetota bacterium]
MKKSARGEVPGLTVAAVARRLGIAPATLRTWDRRYGLGPAERQAGAHRRYSASDLARLEQVRRLINAGVTIGDAAQVVLAAESDLQLESAVVPEQVPKQVAKKVPANIATRTEFIELVPSQTARGLARAADSLDSAACREIITASFERRGVVWTWDSLIAPLLIGIGDRWHATGRGLEVEHALTQVVEFCLGSVAGQLRTPINVRPVLLAAAPEELHALTLNALAGALAERQIEVVMLGQRVPSDALFAAVQRLGPSVVFVWSQAAATGHPAHLADLRKIRPAPALVVGGPGWPESMTPGVIRVLHLAEAVSIIARIVGE